MTHPFIAVVQGAASGAHGVALVSQVSNTGLGGGAAPLGLDAVMSDGSMLRAMSGLCKDNSGDDRKHWLTGSEGNLGIVPSAVLRQSALRTQRHVAFVAVDSPAAALRLLDSVGEKVHHAVHDVVTACDGLIAAEQGIGQYIEIEPQRLKPGQEMACMVRVKRIVDPDNRLNPGKLLPAQQNHVA